MSYADMIYARLPVWAQHAAITTYGAYWRWLRFGRGYGTYLQDYLIREGYTASEWAAWQAGQVHALLTATADCVPYYCEAWSNAEKAAARRGYLQDLPLLPKEPLRAAPKAFLRRDVRPRILRTYDTSGSTGTPIRTIWTIAEIRRSLALREARSARWAGVSFRMPRATFSGRIVEPRPDSRGPYHRYNAAERQVYLSAFHLRPDSARQYVKALEQWQVQWMTGYAVSYYLLAKYVQEQNLKTPSSIKAIVTTSEKLTSSMRAVIESAFKCRVYEEYSTVENVLFVSQCSAGRLHVSPDAGVVEILRPDGSACDAGEVGEVVATGLTRTHQPLIRYRLGDSAQWDSDPCPCGRAMPVIKEVVGRLEDIVVGPDGRQLVRFHGLFVDQPHVREGQVIQESLTRIRVVVVAAEGFGPADVADIASRVRKRLGDVEVVVKPVEAIPRTRAGKFLAVISLLRETVASNPPCAGRDLL